VITDKGKYPWSFVPQIFHELVTFLEQGLVIFLKEELVTFLEQEQGTLANISLRMEMILY
jgi:hypothetical protein